MIDYVAEKHETLLVSWYYSQLKANPEEFAKLFTKNLRSLTAVLNWAATQVRLTMSVDEQGIWGAAWVEPCLSGAYFGTWVRKDMRGTVQAYALVRRAQREALEHFAVLLGITKQPALHRIHLALGYEQVGKIEGLFDGEDAWLYKLTKETIDERRRWRQEQQFDVEHDESLRAGAVRLGEATPETDLPDTPDAGEPGTDGIADRRYKVKSAIGKRADGRRKRGRKQRDGTDAAEARASGA